MTRFTAAFLWAWVSIGSLSTLTGCSTSGPSTPKLTVNSVSLYADLEANQNSAIPVDLVLVYSQEVSKMIATLNAAKYYENAHQLQRDNPTALDVWHWELVPGQSVENFEIEQSRGDAFDGYVFANYLSPGDHRLKIPPSGEVKILLLKNGMKDLALLNVKNITRGVSTPHIQQHATAASHAVQHKKVKQVGRSTADFKDYDSRPKGEEPEQRYPYVFQVPGTRYPGTAGPIDLRPEDSRKGMGGAPSTSYTVPRAHEPVDIHAPTHVPAKTPCPISSGEEADAYEQGPDTHLHYHAHNPKDPVYASEHHQDLHPSHSGTPHGHTQDISTRPLAPSHGLGH